MTAEQFVQALERSMRDRPGRRTAPEVQFIREDIGEFQCRIKRGRPINTPLGRMQWSFGYGETVQEAFEAAVAKLSDADRRAVLGE